MLLMKIAGMSFIPGSIFIRAQLTLKTIHYKKSKKKKHFFIKNTNKL